MTHARAIHADDTEGEVIAICFKCGTPVVLVRNGEETDERERTCCRRVMSFLYIEVTTK